MVNLPTLIPKPSPCTKITRSNSWVFFALRIDMQNDNVINRWIYIFMSMFGSLYTYSLQFLFHQTICVLVTACDFFDRTSRLQYECMRFLLTVFTVFSKIYFHGLSTICLHRLLTYLLHLQYGFLQCLRYVCRLIVSRFIKNRAFNLVWPKLKC